MATDKTLDQQLRDLETLPEAELLAIPQQNIPAVLLAAIWERVAAVKGKKEEDDAFVRRSDRQQRAEGESKERNRERRREQAIEQFQKTMHDVQERSERLAERIAEQEILAREHLRQIDE